MKIFTGVNDIGQETMAQHDLSTYSNAAQNATRGLEWREWGGRTLFLFGIGASVALVHVKTNNSEEKHNYPSCCLA